MARTITLTAKQQTEAVSLVRMLASYDCSGANADRACADTDAKQRHEMCDACHAIEFLRAVKAI